MWIAQISDTHLRPPGIAYQGVVDPAAALTQAVRQINALSPRPAVVVLTGDVVDEDDPAEYAAAFAILRRLEIPLRVIPGNHDSRAGLRAGFPGHDYLPAAGPHHYADATFGPVRLVALDVTVPGAHHGLADPAALAWLEAALAAEPRRPTAILMHQPPLECAVPYLDEYRCFGADALERVVARFPAVERLLCGHVHRHMQMRFGGTLLCTAPSTATAIALHPRPGAAPASFLEPPGFLLHQWRPQAGMLTHAVPLGTFPGPFPFA